METINGRPQNTSASDEIHDLKSFHTSESPADSPIKEFALSYNKACLELMNMQLKESDSKFLQNIQFKEKL